MCESWTNIFYLLQQSLRRESVSQRYKKEMPARSSNSAPKKSRAVTKPKVVGKGGNAASYKVTVKYLWGTKKISAKFPTGAHSGNMWLVSHSKKFHLFREGKLASKGISETAMFGTVDTLAKEASASGEIGSVMKAGVVDVPATFRFPKALKVQKDQVVSFSAMIAPSPDWFVGANSISLRTTAGWISRLQVPLWAYDAGTDSGCGFYNAPDFPESVPKPIQYITGPPLFIYTPPEPIAFLMFEKV